MPDTIGPRTTVAAIVQARFSSQRLPGKVLRLMNGRPMLAYLLEGLTHCATIDRIVVATSTDSSDDPVAGFAASLGVACHRGSMENVAGRVLDAAAHVGAEVLVRLSGDSPLLDPELVDAAVTRFREETPDLVSNVVVRTFPKGQSVEVLSCRALSRAMGLMTTAHEREHVTPYIYAHPEAFAIRALEAAVPRADAQLSVDDEADFYRCEAIIRSLSQPPWQAGWQKCVGASDALQVQVRL